MGSRQPPLSLFIKMRRLYIANFTPERFFGRAGVAKWTVNVSRFMFFLLQLQRVRGMICLIADEVYSLATSIRHRSTSYDYYLASCR